MRYTGSEAYALDEAWEAPYREAEPRGSRQRRSLEVVEGGAPARDARASSATFVALFKCFLAAVAVIAAVGLASVALSTATVTQLTANRAIQVQSASLQDENAELAAERSALSSSDRIDRIATQNYGMVRPTSCKTVTVVGQDATDATPDAGGQAPADASLS